MKLTSVRIATIAVLLASHMFAREIPFSSNWRFLRAETDVAAPDFNDSGWEKVTLPHTARIEALVAGKNAPQWQGICWYRKTFDLPPDAHGKIVTLQFDGAMNTAEVWVNGKSAGKFMGGYLPYVMDISELALPGAKNVVAVHLDNRDNPITGPKPLADLDFNLYGGLYRTAHLQIKERLHITNPLLADRPAGGGVFVTFPEVTSNAATVRIQTHLLNAGTTSQGFTLRSTLLDPEARAIASIETSADSLAPKSDRTVVQQIRIGEPRLWSPRSPSLYLVRSELLANGKVMDSELTRIGIRRLQIDAEGLRINGEKQFLRGCNRHQEYPYIGNALSDAAQYRDARKIKEAGFDYVRLSHYPQSPAFLEACDELGIVVMDCLMGWQYFGKDPAFADLKYQECRQLIRRDRNHPSVMLWEVSLNESDMPKSFVARANAIAHEELPGDQMFTCGWTKGYDVFIQARQHGGCKRVTDQPCVVSEYGDWEYFAQNAGLEQHQWKDLQPAARNSRQLRGDGEARLLQQALNFQEAHNDNLQTRAFADGIWVMFDYNRGYAPEIEASGVMDILRLPKPAYWFFRSQRDPGEVIAGRPVGPLVHIANDWTEASPREVRVFANVEEVALVLNGKPVERRRPDASRLTSHLKHPPFTFTLPAFEAGTLRAVGYRSGREVAHDERRTPGLPDSLALRFDFSGRSFGSSGKDAIFCYAEVQDRNHVVTPTAAWPVFFGTTGGIRCTGANVVLSEAGIATALIESDTGDAGTVYALCLAPGQSGTTQILASSATTDGVTAPCEVRYTLDDAEPSPSSPVYVAPLSSGDAGHLRAAIFVSGQAVVRADQSAKAVATGDWARVGAAPSRPY